MPGHRAALLAATLGLAAGGAGAAFLLPGSTAGPAAGPAATMTTAPPWVSRHEARIGPAVVVAQGLEMEGGRLLFTYEVQAITPQGGTGGPDDRPAPAAPASFTLTYAGGISQARVLTPSQRGARFEVPDGFTPDQVQGVSIDSYWVGAPARFPISLPSSSGAWVPAAPGLQARIVHVVEQADNSLVVLDIQGDSTSASDLAIGGEGREWQWPSSPTAASTRRTLELRGGTPTDPVALVVRGIAWVEVAGGGPIDLEGIPR